MCILFNNLLFLVFFWVLVWYVFLFVLSYLDIGIVVFGVDDIFECFFVFFGDVFDFLLWFFFEFDFYGSFFEIF